MADTRVSGKTTEKHNGFYRTLSRQIFICGSSSLRKCSLFIFCVFGLFSVLIDLDHLIIQETNMVRAFHLPMLIIIWISSISYYAYTNRWFHKHSIGGET